MAARPAEELLYDSEATLRLVDDALDDIRGLESEHSRMEAQMRDLIGSLVDQPRGLAALPQVLLRAYAEIMDGVDRALAMVDELDAEEGDSAAGRGPEIRGALRDELFGMMGSLQFQDITTQQIDYACSVLAEMERRLNRIAHVFDPRTSGLDLRPAAADAGQRQALVGQIFTRTGAA